MTVTAQHDLQLATTISSVGGAIALHSPVILNATTAFSSGGGDLTIFGSGPINSAAGTHNDLSITAGTGNVVFSIAVGTDQSLGAFSVASSKSFTESLAINAQTVAVNAANGVAFNGNVTTTANGTGTVTVNADTDSTGTGTFTVGTGATVNSDNSHLSITAADATITGFLNSGSATTTIQTAQNETIGLGNTAGNLTIDGTELSHITANTLVLGTATTTGMTVDGITSAQSAIIGTTSLNALAAGATTSFLNNSSTFQTLLATAQDNIVFGPGLTITAAAPLTGSLTLTAQTGAMSDTGALTLNAIDGVTLNSNLTTGGALSINADTDNNGTGTLTVPSGVLVNSTNNNLTVLFGMLDLQGAAATTLNSGSATTTLSPTHLQTIGVGLASGHFTVDSTLLSKITAQNLTIGGTFNGNITVDGFATADAPHIPGTITLLAESKNASISFVNHASTFDELSASADNGIQVQQNLTTVGAAGVAGNLFLDGDADNQAASSSPADNIVFSPNVILTAGGTGTITLQAKTGKMSDTGALTLDAHNGVTINSNLTTGTATPGAMLTINADTDANQIGTFTLDTGAAVNTTNNPLDITAADVILFESATPSLPGTLSSGTSTIHLHTSVSTETIGIGAAATQNFSLSNAEIGNIINTTGVVTIGDLTNTGDGHIAATEKVNAHSLNLTVDTGTHIKLDENDLGFNLETTGNLTLTADGDNNGSGAITGGKGIIGANLLTLHAAQGIGNNQNGPGFNTAATTLDAVNTTSGFIAINQSADAFIGHSTGDLVINRVLEQAAGQFISITTSGQLINGSIGSGRNITGPALELIAKTGIGSSSLLATNVSTLAVLNATSGNIQIDNSGSGALIIGTVGSNAVATTVGIQNTGGGFVNLINAGPLTINNNVANSGGGNTTLTTLNGAGNDLTVNALIDAKNGGGSIFLNAGNSLLINDSGNGANNTPDIETQGSGKIAGTAQNAVVLAKNALIQADHGGNIAFVASFGDITTNARIYAKGGNGNIILGAGNNLNLNDSNFDPDIDAQGSGQILGTAGNAVIYGQNVSLQTDQGWTPGTGRVTSLSPALHDLFAPQINVNGQAFVSGSFGDPGAQNFQILVDWHDGTTDTHYFTNPGDFTFYHNYTSFPNTVDQSAPIPITVTVLNDPNIKLIGQHQTPLVTVFDKSSLIPGEKDLQALGNGFQQNNSAPVLADLIAQMDALIAILNPGGFVFPNHTEFTGPQTSTFLTFASVPGNGLGLISIDSNIYITTFHNSPPTTAAIVPTGASAPSTQSQIEETASQQAEATNAEERVVVIEVLNADGSALRDANGNPVQVEMPDTVLDNLDALFKNLPDGRYRISVIEPGESKSRILLDVNLRGHKPADDAEESEGKPPASDAGASTAAPENPQAGLPNRDLLEDSPVVSLAELKDSPLLTATNSDFPAAALIAVAPANSATASRDGNVGRHDSEQAAGPKSLPHSLERSLAETALGLGGLAACVGGRNWEERVDAALAQAGAGALSKTARLARRLMRPAENTTRRAVRRFGIR